MCDTCGFQALIVFNEFVVDLIHRTNADQVFAVIRVSISFIVPRESNGSCEDNRLILLKRSKNKLPH